MSEVEMVHNGPRSMKQKGYSNRRGFLAGLGRRGSKKYKDRTKNNFHPTKGPRKGNPLWRRVHNKPGESG